jgi:DNA-binding XRE family transcriptional regulator
MEKDKQKRVEAAGWKIGDVEELLNLTPEESAYIELKLSLSQNLQKRRRMLNITQQDFARLIKSSQSRVAKMEAGDPSVSLDLLVRSLLALKTPKRELSCMLPK